MPVRQWFRPPRHLPVLFLVVTLVPATGLAWLSWRILQQDRALENQRVQERLEHAAELVTSALERRLAQTEDQLPQLAASPPAGLAEDALIVSFGPDSVEAHPPELLLYHPFLPPTKDPPGKVFAAGETLEFREQNYSEAIAAFRQLARLKDPLIRAGALVRLGRNLRKANRPNEALAVYEELARLGSVPVGDAPAALIGRQARCTVLEELGRQQELEREAAALYRDLLHARWPLDRASYEFHSQEARRWIADQPGVQADPHDALALAAAVESLWEQWRQIRSRNGRPRGRRSVRFNDRSVLLIWDSSPEKLVALVAGPRYLESQWQGAWAGHGVRLALTDAGGHSVLNRLMVASKPQAVRTAAETGLPWTLRVASADPGADLAQLAGRRRLLLAGLALMALIVMAGGYSIFRAVTRELAVARLQSDFVSAVSHEFRTPLTSMRHLTELLEGGVVSKEERRRQYYGMLARETRRLHRLVESLLNFGRMEAGALEYRFEQLDPAELVREVAAEFQEEISTNSHCVEVSINCQAPSIRADREALGRALWNLLDNAAKYSPDCPTIWIELARERESVAIRVRDQGLGIPADEQKEVLRKFVRGAASKAASVKGTGIGLAMVRHIVTAHGGELRLESEPGSGTTFTILLPPGKEQT